VAVSDVVDVLSVVVAASVVVVVVVVVVVSSQASLQFLSCCH